MVKLSKFVQISMLQHFMTSCIMISENLRSKSLLISRTKKAFKVK